MIGVARGQLHVVGHSGRAHVVDVCESCSIKTGNGLAAVEIHMVDDGRCQLRESMWYSSAYKH